MSKLTEAREYVGGLSNPSKMPGLAYSLPALECNAGSKLRDVPNSTCAGCYALKGRYLFKNVQNALYRRLASIDRPDWCAAMATAINGQPWFRWHDSGDLQSIEHLAKIVEVCLATPYTQHWLPTREIGIVRNYLNSGGVIPSNLNIRLSATMVDGKIRSPWKLINTSTVHDKTAPIGYECPAPTQGNQCGDCRTCWDKTVPNISYRKH